MAKKYHVFVDAFEYPPTVGIRRTISGKHGTYAEAKADALGQLQLMRTTIQDQIDHIKASRAEDCEAYTDSPLREGLPSQRAWRPGEEDEEE